LEEAEKISYQLKNGCNWENPAQRLASLLNRLHWKTNHRMIRTDEHFTWTSGMEKVYPQMI